MGLGLILLPAASFVVHLDRPNYSPHSLLVKESDTSVAMCERSTDPN